MAVRRRANRSGGGGTKKSGNVNGSSGATSNGPSSTEKSNNDPDQSAGRNIKLICTLVGFCLYLRSTWICKFPYDDGPALRNNPDVLNHANSSGRGVGVMSPWADFIRNDFWGTPVTSKMTHKSYRPVVIASFRLDFMATQFVNRYILGEERVAKMGEGKDMEHKGAWMFHITNVALYALVCYLVVDVVLLPAAKAASNVSSNNSALIATALSGLWFASHPIHTECVAQIVGRAEILAAILCLIGKQLYEKSKHSITVRALLYGLVMILSLFLACLCKETAVVVPVVFIGTDIAVTLLGPAKSETYNKTDDKKSKSPDAKPASPVFGCLCALSATAGYLFFRSWLFGGRQDLTRENILVQDNFVLHLKGMDKVRTALYIQAKYLQLLLWPNDVSSDYSLGVIDPVFSWTDPNMMLVSGALLGLGFVVVAALRTLILTGSSTLVQGIGWTLAPLVPASHIVTIGTPMADRLLFTPSIGMAVIICHFVVVLANMNHSKVGRNSQNIISSPKLSTPGLISIFIVSLASLRLAVMTHQRIPEWKDSRSVFDADIQKFPRSLKLNIAEAKGWWGETADDAAKSYEHARIAQEVVDSYGDALRDTPYIIGLPLMAFQKTRNQVWPQGANLNEALELVDKVIALDKQHPTRAIDELAFAFSARGQALLKMGLPKQNKHILSEAERAFQMAEKNDVTKRAPYITYCSYGVTLAVLGGRFEEAYGQYQTCFQRKPVAEVGLADIGNYCNVMAELSGVRIKNDKESAVKAAAKWGEKAIEAFSMIVAHPEMKDTREREKWTKISAITRALMDKRTEY